MLDANAAAESTLGRSREALRGRRLEAIFEALGVGSDGEELAGTHRRPAARRRPARGRAAHAPTHARSKWSAGALGSVGSQPAGRFVSLTDRTLQRRNERLLRERQKLESVGILAAGVAHEINNPLAFVRANLVHVRTLAERIDKLVDLDPAGPDADLLELGTVVEESLEGVVRIARIVNDMLRFSRVPEEAAEAVDLNDVVRVALRLAAFDRNNAVAGGAAPGGRHCRAVRGSANRLVQVLLNLLLNANQALVGRADARVVAESARDGRNVIVRVPDNGPGIPEEQRRPRLRSVLHDARAGRGHRPRPQHRLRHRPRARRRARAGGAQGGACFTIRLPAAAGS